MHRRVLYQPVNVEHYSEDSFSVFAQDVDYVSGAISVQLYTIWGFRFARGHRWDIHQAFFDSYNVRTMYAGISHSCVPTNLAVDRYDDPGCWSSSILSDLSLNRTLLYHGTDKVY